MSANMSRLRQVGGMSTRESLNRPRSGVTDRWQGERVLDDRLNKAACRGYDGPATAVWVRGKVFDEKGKSHNAGFPKAEKIWSTGTDVAYLIRNCRRVDPNWKPSRFAPKADREHKELASRGLLD
jgi:hypothetical protein